MVNPGSNGLVAALSTARDGILDRTTELYERSGVRMPGTGNTELARQMLGAIIEAIAEAFSGEQLAPGSPELRELEKSVAFVASSWAADRRSGFDLIAMLLALRDALHECASDADRQRLAPVFDWLFALAADAFGLGGVRAEYERNRQALERGMPVVTVTPELPAAFLVGELDRYTLDGVFGRLAMLVVRVGARAVIIDATGLGDSAAKTVLGALERFLRQRELAGKLAVLVVGLSSEAERQWSEVARGAGAEIRILASFDQAVTCGLESTEQRLIRRPS